MVDTATEVRLVSACPGDSCSKSDTIQWVHYCCGSELRIDQECDVWCQSHTSTKQFIQNWRFRCGKDSHGGDHFVGWSLDALASAMSYIAKSFTGTASKKMLLQLNNKLYERWDD